MKENQVMSQKTLEQHLAENPVSDDPTAAVFLGGSCNPTIWRFEEAIPALNAAGISYYNPQMPTWDPDKYGPLEEAAKKQCKKLLFVIDGQTRAIYSCFEIIDFAHKRPKNLVVVIDDIEDGTNIRGQVVTGRELGDINTARGELRRMLAELNVTVHETVTEAIQAIISDLKSWSCHETKILTLAGRISAQQAEREAHFNVGFFTIKKYPNICFYGGFMVKSKHEKY